MQISAKGGAETSVYLASADEVKDISGKCFAKKKEVETCPFSYDQKVQERLWNETIRLLKL
jgi:hypothetical protein